MKKSSIYVLVDADPANARMKVGHSVDPHLRQQTLEQSFDLEKSFRVERNKDEIRKIEQAIHDEYAEFRIPAAEIGDCVGKTEWFRIECFEDMKADIEKYIGKPMPIKPEMVTLTIKVPAYLHKRIKLSTIPTYSTVQDDILAILEAHYSEPVQGAFGMV